MENSNFDVRFRHLNKNDKNSNINSYPIDFTCRELYQLFKDNRIIKSHFHLEVDNMWDKVTFSKLIESVVLGYPIPSIVLCKTHMGNYVVIDGNRRITAICDYIAGEFSHNKKKCDLSNSMFIAEYLRKKTFNMLTQQEQNKILDTTIHAVVLNYADLKNDTQLYQLYERYHTETNALSNQEVRFVAFFGKFSDLIMELNQDVNWQNLL